MKNIAPAGCVDTPRVEKPVITRAGHLQGTRVKKNPACIVVMACQREMRAALGLFDLAPLAACMWRRCVRMLRCDLKLSVQMTGDFSRLKPTLLEQASCIKRACRPYAGVVDKPHPSSGGGAEFDPYSVVYRRPDALFAAEVSLSRLDRDMAQQELDLLRFAAMGHDIAEHRCDGGRGAPVS